MESVNIDLLFPERGDSEARIPSLHRLCLSVRREQGESKSAVQRYFIVTTQP